MTSRIGGWRAGAALLLLLVPAARPADFSFSGTLASDDDQKSFFFTLTQAGTATIKTASYATGGFDPSLAVFDAAGNLIATNQDGGCARVAANPVTGFCWDAYLSLSLPAGTYQAVITQSNNVAAGPTFANAFAYTGQGSFTAPPGSTGSFYDASGLQGTGSFAVAVQAVSSAAPQFSISSQTPPGGQVGTPYSYQFVSAGGSAPATWSVASGTLPAGLTLSASGLLSGTPTAYGSFPFSLQATDSSSPAMTAAAVSFTITIIPSKLLLTTSALTPWDQNSAYSQTLMAAGGAPPYTWSLTGNPGGLSLSSAGVLSGTPAATGTFTVPVAVTDTYGASASASLTWVVDTPLAITSKGGPAPGALGNAYAGYTFTASGGAAATPVWSVSGGTLPSGMTLTAAGKLQGTPQQTGVFNFTAQVTDGIQPARVSSAVSVYSVPGIVTSSLGPATAGVSYSASLIATGGSGSFSWSGSPPAGLGLSGSGQISGTPTTGGQFSFSVTVTDTVTGLSASAGVSITIAYPPIVITGATALKEVAAGAAISQSYSASGGDKPYNWSGSGLPAGLSIDPASGTLSGSTGAGNFSFGIQVTDTLGSTAKLTATLAVLGIATPSAATTSTTASFTTSFSALGGVQPYTFSASGLPPGLSLSGSGVISGKATASGSFSVTVQVTDGAGVKVSTSFALTVTPPPAVLVAGGSLAGGTIGTVYSASLSATGGLPPYKWAVIGGALPDGLSAGSSGSVSGMPTRAGSFTFTAQATDGNGTQGSGAFTIAVAPAPLTPPPATSLPSGQVGADYSAQLTPPTGGTTPFTYAVGSGTLPAGLTLSGGQIAGTPQSPGTSSFTVSITDSSVPALTTTESLAITIAPASSDILISSGSVGFSLTSGTSAVPGADSVVVRSSNVAVPIVYSVAASPAVPWLNVTGGGTTPGSIGISLNASALSLAAAATPYMATVTATCQAPSPCAGKSQNIQVSLTVTSPPAALSLATNLLSFSASTSSPSVPSQSLTIQNSGGGSLAITGVSAADSFVTVSGVPASVSPGPGASVSVGINAAGLSGGYYRSSITVLSSAGSATVPVTLYLAQSSSFSLSPSGSQLGAQAGSSPGNGSGSFGVTVSGPDTIQWNASVVSATPWLILNSSSGSASAVAAGTVSYSVDANAVAALSPGVYYGQIGVSAPNASNSTQYFELVLNVTAGVAPQPAPSPSGLVFITNAGAAPGPQTVTVYTSSKTPVGFQASASTTDGANWLSVSPSTGTTSTAVPGTITATVDPTKVTPGVYSGGITISLSSSSVPTVNVTLIVPAAGTSAQDARPGAVGPKASCTPTKLVPTQTGLANNFAQPAAWPVPLTIQLFDDCGKAVGSGQMVATFTNGDPPLALQATDQTSGNYSATWTPRSPAPQVTISARASATGFPNATAQLVGAVKPNQAPALTPHGTLHAFDPQVGAALGPGNIVQIYGSNLAASTLVASSIPLPTVLGGTSVIVGGVAAPLYFVSAGQINAQLPFELAPNSSYQILVSANGALTTPDSVQVVSEAPGIAAFASGQIIAQEALTGSLITETAPAAPGDYVVFYMAGLGMTNNPVVSGAASPSSVLAVPLAPPSLTLGTENVPILFAGLTPGLVGLYQVNFQVPADAPNGDLQLVIMQGGTASNSTILPVHK